MGIGGGNGRTGEGVRRVAYTTSLRICSCIGGHGADDAFGLGGVGGHGLW